MRVAFIQNRVQLGGRFQVTFEMTKVLNALGIVPDFYAYRFRLTEHDIQEHYGSTIKLSFKPIPEPKLPFEWNITNFNRQVNKHLKEYDLVINSNNTSLGLEEDINLLSYVHYPRKARILRYWSWKSFFQFDRDPFLLNLILYNWHVKTGVNDLQVANSKFTAEEFENCYHTRISEVLYPPVQTRVLIADKNPKQIISLGRFSPNKRQIEQIVMMRELPNHELFLVGFKNDLEYFNKCQKVIDTLWLTNVHLVPDAGEEERDKLLASSTFFIHSLRSEPFGITTVQGIAAGCIPIVHNSGGQTEIVEDEFLRYNNEAEIPEKINQLEGKDLLAIRKKLQIHIKQYDAVSFRRQFKKILEAKIPEV
jgi:glycosyltransferase involved in cell wall biosynthesis